MDIVIDPHWQSFVDGLVETGRYDTGNAVIVEGLRLVEEREAKLQALRDTLDESIKHGEWYSDEEVGEHIRTSLDRWEQARQA